MIVTDAEWLLYDVLGGAEVVQHWTKPPKIYEFAGLSGIDIEYILHILGK